MTISDEKKRADAATRRRRRRVRERDGLRCIRFAVAEDDARAYVIGTGRLLEARSENWEEVERAIARWVNRRIADFAGQEMGEVTRPFPPPEDK